MNLGEFYPLMPGIALALCGLLTVAVDVAMGPRPNPVGQRILLNAISYAGLGSAAMFVVKHLLDGRAPERGFHNGIILDETAALLDLAVIGATFLFLLASTVDAHRRRIAFGEFYGLVLLCASGMVFLAGSTDFMMIFLNLEILSLALYVLTGITRLNPRSSEAAMKYLITGGFATGFLMFGLAMMYGATGTIQLDAIGAWLRAGHDSGLMVAGVGLMLVGIGFKIGAVPFHMWVPDVYEGAPTSVTAFMSVAVKTVGIGVLFRILHTSLWTRPDLWAQPLAILAVLTIVVGNLLAVRQTSVKRMLAYSSVAHTGYALVALTAMSSPFGTLDAAGGAAALFYVFSYTFMTMGAFLFLVYVGHEAPGRTPGKVEWQDAESFEDLAGMAWRQPWAAFAMTIFLVSLGGIPPTVGFFGKFYLLRAAVDQGWYGLAIVTVLGSLVSMYYYLRVVVVMYMRDPQATDEKPELAIGSVLAVSAVLTVLLGLLPGQVIELAERSAGLRASVPAIGAPKPPTVLPLPRR